MDYKQHKIMLSKVLIELYKHPLIGSRLGFKWGTCAMFFYGLPRMSVDLDFDLLADLTNYQDLIPHITTILSQFGKIDDYQDKHYTIYYELNYWFGNKNMKIEISKRWVSGAMIQQNFLGENILIMTQSDLFTNKLVALLHRSAITNRDIFDIRYFLQNGTNINHPLLESKIQVTAQQYLQQVQEFIQWYDFSKILYGLGELIDDTQKIFMKTKMKDQILWYLSLL